MDATYLEKRPEYEGKHTREEYLTMSLIATRTTFEKNMDSALSSSVNSSTFKTSVLTGNGTSFEELNQLREKPVSNLMIEHIIHNFK